MTSEQLHATRAIRWRQNSDPILTLEDAEAWLQQAGLCLFLPRKAQLNCQAPSFVEACLGEANPTPPRAAIEAAREMLSRLIDANLAIPLNLLGTAADHPDFLVSPDTLPFVFGLRGDRDWKHAPGSGTTRVSPLVQQIWKVLERKGVLSASEIKDEIGRELTEAAALRALYELWSAMRITPLYQTGGEPTLWEALQTRQQKALNAGTNMSQVTALSVLVSLYLESAVAATSDEVEIFLSPLSSRSKVREAVRGLTATRQLAMLPMERETLLHVEGSLPEFDEPLSAAPNVPPEVASEERHTPRRPLAGAASRRTSGSTMEPRAAAGSRPEPSKRTFGTKRPFPAKSGGRPPDTISVWPRPVPLEPAPLLNPSADQSPERPSERFSERPGKKIFATAGDSPRSERAPRPRERTPARPPWKDKGKPGFAKSAAARGEKARWPRERAPGGPARPGESTAAPRPRGEFKPTGDFKPRSRPEARPAEGFRSASPSDAGTRPRTKSASPRPPSGEFKPRGDFKDFKARKQGDFKRRSPTTPSRTGARAPVSGGFKPRPGGEFRQPWKDAGDRPARAPGMFGARDGGSGAPRSPYKRSRPGGNAGDSTAPSERPSGRPFSRPGGGAGARSSGPGASGFKPRSNTRSGPDRGSGPYSPSSRPRSTPGSGRSSAPNSEKLARPRTFGAPQSASAPRSSEGRSFKGGPGTGFKGGFKRPPGKPGSKPERKAGTGPRTFSHDSSEKRGFAKKPGFSKRSGPPSGPSSYKGSESRRPSSRGPASRGPGGPPSRSGRPGSSRPSGPPRPKRKAE